MKLPEKYIRLIKDTGIFAVGSLGSKLILFFLVPVYTNYMSDSQYGTADLVYTVGQLVLPFVSIVIFDSIVRFGLSKTVKRENVLLGGLLVCCAGSVVTFLMVPLFALYSAIAQWKWILAFYIIFSMFNCVIMNYLKVKDLNKLYAGLSIMQTAILALLNVWLLCFAHLGVTGYLLSMVVASGFTVLAAFLSGRLACDLRKARFEPSLLKQMILFSAPLILNNLSWWVIQSSDKIMIEAMIGAGALGVFTVATKIPSLINVTITIFSQAWGLSTIREIESTNDTRFYSNVFGVYQAFAFGAAIFLIAVIKPFMEVYVGSGFIDAWRYVPLLLVAASFGAVSSYYGSLYSALKKSTNNMLTTLLAALLNIVINLVGIHYIGIWGAVLGTVASYFVLAFARMIDVGRFIRIDVKNGRYVSNVAIAFAEAIAVSLDFYGFWCSILCCGLFLAINGQMVIDALRKRNR